MMHNSLPSRISRLCFVLAFWTTLVIPSFLAAQNSNELADRALAERPTVDRGPDLTNASMDSSKRLNVLELVWAARWLMIPIIAMSIVVVAVGIERILALRRSRVMPKGLVEYLESAKLDSRGILRTCTEYPSTMAVVVREVLRKFGRPPGEVETTMANVMQRESERLYRNVRTLNLAAAVTPLMGLLGTVWGMIAAFFATANLPVGANKAESLAEGIYFALVTTAAGLVVAIPAAILAHYLEGRIQKLFLDMEESLSEGMLQQMAVSRMEMKARHANGNATVGKPPTPPPVSRAVAAK